MTPKFNLKGIYVAFKYKLVEVTLKFNLIRSNSQKFPVIKKVYIAIKLLW